MVTSHRTRSRRLLYVFFGILLLTALPAAAQGASPASRTMTPEDVDSLRRVSEVAISPDGMHIAYTLWVPRDPWKEENGPAWSELHVVGNNGESRPFITGEVSVQDISWTPSGEAIAFRSQREGDDETALYTIALAGGEARRLASHATGIRDYSFNGDGSRLAFLAREEGPDDKLKDKGFNAEVFEENDRFVHIYVQNLAGDSNDEPKALEVEGSATELHWSPAGNRLAVALAPTPRIDDNYTSRKVHVLDADSGEVVTRFDNPGKLGPVAWNPTGTHLAFISAEDANDPSAGRLMVGDVAAGTFENVLPHYPGQVDDLGWLTDTKLVFLGSEGVWTSFGRVGSNGYAHRDLIPAAGNPAWTALSISPNGPRAALIGETPGHPPELFRWVADQEAERLTNSNPVLDEIRLAEQEVVTFEARDGMKIEGLLIRPLDEQEGTRYPLILTVHGGPESHHRNGWLTSYNAPGQLAAAQGYAVFYTNYRGSTGRGVEFSKVSQADPAGAEFEDLIDAVDHLIEIGLVDQDKVGITGGSYGGYASAWGATYFTERFAASVMFVGISAKIAKSGTTDIPNEEYLVHARRWPWEKWDFMMERSPVTYVEQARTPILILHGEEDPRVHPSQSLILYRYLKLVGKTPVRLIWYPGEGHGNRKAAARMDYNRRMMRWFDHYLKGPGGEPPAHDIEWPQMADESDGADDTDDGESEAGE
ncbi:MAG: S9 family peptidase [Acidobacteriota bacterium]